MVVGGGRERGRWMWTQGGGGRRDGGRLAGRDASGGVCAQLPSARD